MQEFYNKMVNKVRHEKIIREMQCQFYDNVLNNTYKVGEYYWKKICAEEIMWNHEKWDKHFDDSFEAAYDFT